MAMSEYGCDNILNQEINVSQMQAMVLEAAKMIIQHEPELTAIDERIGDGDHGYGMKEGFSEVYKVLEKSSFTSLYELLKTVGITLVKTMGGASGVIFGTLFTGGYEVLENLEVFNARDWISYLEKGACVISRRGKCQEGDKTMLDALSEAINAMKRELSKSASIQDILLAAYDGAVIGMENTKNMRSKLGRSKNFRGKEIGWPDPGAMSVTYLFKGFLNGYQHWMLENNKNTSN